MKCLVLDYGGSEIKYCVMDDQGRLIEIQGTGEGRPFTLAEQQRLVELCAGGIGQLIQIQKQVLG